MLAPSKSFEKTLETRGLARKTFGAQNLLEPYGMLQSLRAHLNVFKAVVPSGICGSVWDMCCFFSSNLSGYEKEESEQ